MKDEIEVTEEMLAAGFKVFTDSHVVDEPLEADKLLVAEIYQAMAAVAQHQK